MPYQILFSPQVKRYAVISYKLGIYELSHELSKDLRLGIFGTPYNDTLVRSNNHQEEQSSNIPEALSKPIAFIWNHAIKSVISTAFGPSKWS